MISKTIGFRGLAYFQTHPFFGKPIMMGNLYDIPIEIYITHIIPIEKTRHFLENQNLQISRFQPCPPWPAQKHGRRARGPAQQKTAPTREDD